MRPQLQHDAEPDAEVDAVAPAPHYRVAGDVEVRGKVLEQELAEANARVAAMEREVWAARKALRNQKRLSTLAAGGLGALVGALAGIAAWALGQPAVIVWLTVLGFVFGLVAGMRGGPPDDGFPPAPRARLRSGPTDL